MTDDERNRGVWVPALALGGEATPQQRARNHDLYQRLKNGVPEAERRGLRGSPLHMFDFYVPSEIVSVAPRGEISFRLRPDDECFRRLVNCIIDCCPENDEVDEQLRLANIDACNESARALAAESRAERAEALLKDAYVVMNELSVLSPERCGSMRARIYAHLSETKE